MSAGPAFDPLADVCKRCGKTLLACDSAVRTSWGAVYCTAPCWPEQLAFYREVQAHADALRRREARLRKASRAAAG